MKLYLSAFYLCMLFNNLYSQDCSLGLEYNNVLKRKQMSAPYVTLGALFGPNIVTTFAKMDDSAGKYILYLETVLDERYVSTIYDSLVFRFKDKSKLKFVHRHTSNPIQRRFMHVFMYYSYHSFDITEDDLRLFARRPVSRVTLYITGASGAAFDHFPERKRRRYGRNSGQKTQDVRRIKNRRKKNFQRMAACILQAKDLAEKQPVWPKQ